MSKDISQSTLDLAGKIKTSITMDNKTGLGAAAGDIFEKTLPEDLTMATVKTVRDHETTFIAASVVAAGDLALDALAGNKELEQAVVSIPMGGRNAVDVTTVRSKTFQSPATGTFDKIGHTSVKHTNVASRHQSGELKLALASIADQALERLK